MRILHLVNHCRLGHGNAHVAVDLACQQALMGDDVVYASEGGEFVDMLEREGVRHEMLRQNSGSPFRTAISLCQLIWLIERFKPDIVHAHMMSGAVLGGLATRLTARKLVTTVHNSFDRHSALMRLGHRIVAVSEAERASLLARGFPAQRLDVVLNAPLGTARGREFPPVRPGPIARPSICTICGLHPRKGVQDIIKAFGIIAKTHSTVHFYIVGDGPSRPEYEEFAKASGYGHRIHFLGTLSNPSAVLEASDIFVLASYADPAPLVIPEARAHGCAVVASHVGGVPELLDAGQAGLLFQAGDPVELAGILDRLLSSTEALGEAKTRAKANCERFLVERLWRGYRSVYLRALEGTRFAAESAASR